jgi:cyclohexanone monooxygenase
VWQEGGPQAYLGTVIAGFPNLFFLIGPNTGLGNNSMINIIEGQLVFLLDALRGMQEAGADAIEVHRAVQDRYNAALQEAMVGTVWTEGGCSSWYLTPDGTNRTLWPSFSDAFKRRLRGFDIADFAVTASSS